VYKILVPELVTLTSFDCDVAVPKGIENDTELVFTLRSALLLTISVAVTLVVFPLAGQVGVPVGQMARLMTYVPGCRDATFK
jgi:hypothetical protein